MQNEAPLEFWRNSGYGLVTRGGPGQGHGLIVTDDFLRAYLMRPEVTPPDDACAAERALHARLLANPREAVSEGRIAALADADARENWQHLIAFRDRLLRAPSIEAALLGIHRSPKVTLPPLFIDQLTHLVLRGMLEGCADPFMARAGELLFRTQSVAPVDGGIMLADHDVVELHAKTGGFGGLGALVRDAGTDVRSIDLDVMTEANAGAYWARSDRFDMVLDLTFGRRGLDGLARVLEAFVRHLLGAEVRIQPVQTISDERWVWHVGLDHEASRIMNALWNGAAQDEVKMERVLALFRLEFSDPAQMLARVRGRPVYLGLAMTAEKTLKLKPQNLIVNLPLAQAA